MNFVVDNFSCLQVFIIGVSVAGAPNNSIHIVITLVCGKALADLVHPLPQGIALQCFISGAINIALETWCELGFMCRERQWKSHC